MLASSLKAFVLEHPPRGVGIFSLNSFPFRPFQYLQLIVFEWEALSCSCSLNVLCSLAFSLFSSPFPLLLSHHPSLFFHFLCHIYKLVLSFCWIPIAERHWRQQMFLFLSTMRIKWCFKMHLFSRFQLLCFNLVFQWFCFDLWPASRSVKQKVTRSRDSVEEKGKKCLSQQTFWQITAGNAEVCDGWILQSSFHFKVLM